MRRLGVLHAIAIGSLLLSASALADGDPARGERVLHRCKSCHEVDRDRNRNGPHLLDLFGRVSGSVDGFRYSDAMNEAAIVWSDETLDGYLENPRSYLPGTRMTFAGLRSDQDRQDVIAYLKQVTAAD